MIEFTKADLATAIKAAYELGLVEKPQQVRYRVTADVATVDESDYMAANKLFNLLLQANREGANDALSNQIKSLSKGFQFGSTLHLRRQPPALASYQLNPPPRPAADKSHDQVSYSFDQTAKLFDIPYVTIEAEITCFANGQSNSDRQLDDSLLAATPYWPVDDPEVQALAAKITAGKSTQRTKVQSILEWLTPGRHIKSDGPRGSRWGVKKVLQQKYGHCWDSADCFVTLARAAGVPCRQVGGWMFGSSGHIWAEVLVAGQGWQQVDPTGGGKLECGIYHIPYFTTESGAMPILYASMPRDHNHLKVGRLGGFAV